MIESRTVIVSLVLGTVLAVLSALLPALRATRVPPVTGLREGAVLETPRGPRAALRARHRARRRSASSLMLLGVFGALDPARPGSESAPAPMFIGVALLSPQLVTPAGLARRAAARAAARHHRAGSPARTPSAIPGRTASTAAALMIGLALVTFVTVFAAGLKGSINNAIDQTFAGDLILSNNDGFSDIPVKTADASRSIDGVDDRLRPALHPGQARRESSDAAA